ncbi:Protein CBG14623 [Caenorhabditis briggsae]|uniref:Protein CBG14623 n=1 Tax=Caenorhabditis briggsae TaxID=6238 RepID=A8XKB2_CAEBR|nr:Protein CBG14623 [Caenorhabditis briggsae]CAP33086.2 Protein CBG14623 [Caenorhabditis briggsae]
MSPNMSVLVLIMIFAVAQATFSLSPPPSLPHTISFSSHSHCSRLLKTTK